MDRFTLSDAEWRLLLNVMLNERRVAQIEQVAVDNPEYGLQGAVAIVLIHGLHDWYGD